MTSRIWMFGAIVAGALMLVTGFSFAQGLGPGMGRGEGHGGGMGYGDGMGRGFGGGGHGAGRHGPNHQGNPVRHRIVRNGPGVPKPYAGLSNPLKGSADVIAAGKALYAEHCASCHGAAGQGNGEAGKGLDPRPANLAFVIDKWIATDDFLMWSIADGGVALKTAMPAFKDALSETERWQVITYLREGL